MSTMTFERPDKQRVTLGRVAVWIACWVVAILACMGIAQALRDEPSGNGTPSPDAVVTNEVEGGGVQVPAGTHVDP